MLETLLRDLRFAVRSLAGRPGFTTAALLTLALGIGANTAMFSLVNALLLRPLPFGTRSERVVTLHSTHPTQARDWQDSRISYSDLEDVKAANRSFEDVAGYVSTAFTLTAADSTDAEAVRVQGGSVTPNLFPLLGVEPMLGRQFRPEEAQTFGFAQVALLGHNLWQRRFAGDPDIVGKAVRVNGRSLTIVGVLPGRFKFPERDEMYVPFRPSEPRRDQRFVLGVGVLRQGVTLAQARAEVDGIARALADRFPDTNRRWGLQVLGIRDLMVGPEVRLIAPTLLGAVGFVLLIGCANLANLLLARGAARQREMAVRTAIGASRGHLVRQMLGESLLLAAGGGALGGLLSVWGVDLLVASFPEELPYWVQWDLDARVFAFTTGLTVVTAFGFGLLPALRASKPDLVGELKDGGRGAAVSPSQKRLQSALVVVQVALCLALLVGANLMIRSFLELQRADSGFDETRLLSLRLYLAGDVYDPVEAKAAFFRRAVETLHALPGVAQAAATTTIPTDDGGRAVRLVAEGQAAAPGDETGGSLIGTTPLSSKPWECPWSKAAPSRNRKPHRPLRTSASSTRLLPDASGPERVPSDGGSDSWSRVRPVGSPWSGWPRTSSTKRSARKRSSRGSTSTSPMLTADGGPWRSCCGPRVIPPRSSDRSEPRSGASTPAIPPTTCARCVRYGPTRPGSSASSGRPWVRSPSPPSSWPASASTACWPTG